MPIERRKHGLGHSRLSVLADAFDIGFGVGFGVDLHGPQIVARTGWLGTELRFQQIGNRMRRVGGYQQRALTGGRQTQRAGRGQRSLADPALAAE